MWDRAFDVNVRAHVRAAQLLVPRWLDRGEGYFVSTASAAGLLTQIGSATYSVTKHAAVGFAEWLSVTYGNKGIRVSCLCPMGVETALLREGERSGTGLGDMATRAVTSAGKVLEPSEVAHLLAGTPPLPDLFGLDALHAAVLGQPSRCLAQVYPALAPHLRQLRKDTVGTPNP